MSEVNPYAAPRAIVGDPDGSVQSSSIKQLPVSDAWKAKFHLIERAGGVKLPRVRELSAGERLRANFNVLAFLFGPFYYIAKGMVRKGITLFVVCVAMLTAIDVVLELMGVGSLGKALGYAAATMYAIRANIDYYKKMVLNENG